jgi:hypothetical protein
VDCDEYNIKLSPGHHLQLELSAIDKILPLLFARKWLLLRAPKGSSGFVTCDYPACLMWSGPERRNNFFPPGHGLHGTQLVFPVSRELAIIGAFDLFDEERDADENLIAQVNTTIIAHAERQFYARDGEFVYLSPYRGKIMRGTEIIKDRLLTERQKEGVQAKRKRSTD